MTTKTTDRRVLKVRRRIWPEPGEPKTAYWYKDKWVACKDLDAARRYADRHGYGGIKIEPI